VGATAGTRYRTSTRLEAMTPRRVRRGLRGRAVPGEGHEDPHARRGQRVPARLRPTLLRLGESSEESILRTFLPEVQHNTEPRRTLFQAFQYASTELGQDILAANAGTEIDYRGKCLVVEDLRLFRRDPCAPPRSVPCKSPQGAIKMERLQRRRTILRHLDRSFRRRNCRHHDPPQWAVFRDYYVRLWPFMLKIFGQALQVKGPFRGTRRRDQIEHRSTHFTVSRPRLVYRTSASGLQSNRQRWESW
jgi:hypothetical protein